MVENFLFEIYRRLKSSRQVAIFIDGNNMSKKAIKALPQLREKVKELGDIRIAEVMYESNIPQSDFDFLRQNGFTDKVVPGNIELTYLLEVYDIVLEKKVDFIVLGTHRESLIPMFSEARKNVTIFAYVESLKKVSKAFVESVDGIIEMDKINEFSFESHSIPELEQLIQSPNGSDRREKSDYVGEEYDLVDDANIGPVSEDIIDEDLLIEDMKQENKQS